ncbi:MAG: HEAT repeat domain-containing protein [Planctomycetes bacterium]|nr:HEAT repeat domain-containing protein [Planctomycetota bacterium]
MKRLAAIALVVAVSACDRGPAKKAPPAPKPPVTRTTPVQTPPQPRTVEDWLRELDSPDPLRRRQAQDVLRQLNENVLPTLIPALADPDHEKRRAAIEAISQLGSAAAPAASALARAAMDGSQETAWSVTPILVRKLGAAGETALVEALREPDTAKALLLFSSIDNTDRTGTQDFAVWILERALRTHAEPAVRRQAVAVLTRLECDRALACATVLHALLEDADPGVRAACARFLGRLSSDDDDLREAAMPALREAANDSDPAVSRAVTIAITRGAPGGRFQAENDARRREEEAAILEKQGRIEEAAVVVKALLEDYDDDTHAEAWRQALERYRKAPGGK